MKDKIFKLYNAYKKYGFVGFIKKCSNYIQANYLDKISLKVFFHQKDFQNQIEDILTSEKYERIVLWRSSFGYDVPLFQRPQHIANNLSKNKCLVFYEVTTMTDKVKTYKKISDNLYLFNFNNTPLNKILSQELDKINKPKYIQLYSTDWKLSVQDIEKYLDNNYKLIYEYVDDISPELSGTKEVPKNIIDKYEYVMTHTDVYVIVTALELQKKVEVRRGTINMAYSSNGVDYDFFQHYDENYKYDKQFNQIMKLGKPIVCYYGALAKWFDYDLIKSVAKTDKYSVVLFGIKYDESFDENISNEKNIYFLGSRDYKVLKNYSQKCDILTIPFLINNITDATSPVKIFEYMALHKPIVITDLKECRKYKSALISKNAKEFIKNLDIALEKSKDKKYIDLLDKEARENDWSHKAMEIIKLIKKDEEREERK